MGPATQAASTPRSSSDRSVTLDGGMALLHTALVAISLALALMRAGVSSSSW